MSDLQNNNNSQRNTGFRAVLPFYIMYDLDLNANHLRFYCQIEQMESNPNPNVNPTFSYLWMAKQLGMSRRKCIDVANFLRKKGYIEHTQINEKTWIWHTKKKPITQASIDLLGGDPVRHSPSDPVRHSPSDPGGHPKIIETKILENKYIGDFSNTPIEKSIAVDSSLGDFTFEEVITTQSTGNPYCGENPLPAAAAVSLAEKVDIDYSKPKSKPNLKKHYKDDERFMRFYNAYPRHHKPRLAYKEFLSEIGNDDALLETVMSDVALRKLKDSQWKNKQYILYPSNYLKQAGWESEILDLEAERLEKIEQQKLIANKNIENQLRYTEEQRARAAQNQNDAKVMRQTARRVTAIGDMLNHLRMT